jgi:molecular chaperone GrpE
MTDEPKTPTPQSPTDQSQATGQTRPTHPGADIGPDQLRAIVAALQAELEQQQSAVEAKEAQLEASNDKYLRARADLDNMRKRVEREKEDTAKYAITKFARDVVQVADNFERAIMSVPAEAKINNAALNSLLDGVTLTEREFLNVLERHGVKRISPQGEAFNPHHHQAVMETVNPDVATGTILQVFQAGYIIEDRVVRPAMVVVSTGGPRPSRPAAVSQPGEEPDEDDLS